ncbi:MAG: hypothetical protein LBE08_04950 [Bifidobacteriaceae bacterium]|jgi:hypothetical protein|nr:hypothetical protein [Bifidobacteriaceae bacterium]
MTTTISARQFDQFLQASKTLLPPPRDWPQLTTYPGSLAECIIDAIWSERVRYATVETIVNRYRAYRAAQGGNADTDGAPQLVKTFEIGLDAWMEQIGNHQRAYSRGVAPYKADLVYQAAQAAIAAGIETARQLRDGYSGTTTQFQEFHRRWLDLPSQHTGLTFERLVLVAGVETVPLDPWLEEFASNTVGAALTNEAAINLIEAAARVMDVTPLRLRNAIWQYQNHFDQARHTSPAGSNRVAAGAAANEPLA